MGGVNLVDVFAGYERVIVFDSIRTRGGTPGTWYRFTARSLRETMNLRNVHDTNLGTALELGRRLGIPLPPDEEIHVFAVEVLDNTSFDEHMSEALESGFAEYARGILQEVRTLIAG